MSNLADLPGLGKPTNAAPKFREEDSGGFDDFDFEEDHLGDSSNKFDEAEKSGGTEEAVRTPEAEGP